VAIHVETGSRVERDLAQMAADQLYDLVQMARPSDSSTSTIGRRGRGW
jgi:hypothetical protein